MPAGTAATDRGRVEPRADTSRLFANLLDHPARGSIRDSERGRAAPRAHGVQTRPRRRRRAGRRRRHAPAGLGRGVRGQAFKAVEPNQIGRRRVSQGFRRGQADAQAGIRAGPDADGDDVQITDVQPGRLEQVAHAGDQIAAVFRAASPGPVQRSEPRRKLPPPPGRSRSRSPGDFPDRSCPVRDMVRTFGWLTGQIVLRSWIRGLDPSPFFIYP